MFILVICSVFALLIGLICLNRGSSLYGRLGLLMPTSCIAYALLLKVVLGLSLVWLLGFFSVPQGEYRQYIVTHAFVLETSVLWLVWLICLLAILTLGRLVIRYKWGGASFANSKRAELDKNLFFLRRLVFGQRTTGVTTLSIITIVFGLVSSLYFLVGIFTGSIDRGAAYDTWSGLVWRPTDGFVAISRLRTLMFFLSGLLIARTDNRLRYFLLLEMILILGLTLLSGGRGDFAYSVLALVGGLFILKGGWRRYGAVVLTLLIVSTLFIPVMGAIREMKSFKESSLQSPMERIHAVAVSIAEIEGFSYRVSTLGREIYACSDGYIFEEERALQEDRQYKRFSDLSLERLFFLITPKLVHGRIIEKFDGSRLAQSLMKIDFQPTWFPCISIVGDLYYRSALPGLVLGGLVVGMLLLLADSMWELLMHRDYSPFRAALCLLTISFIQSLPLGTVQETVWFWFWDLPKYVGLFLIMDWIYSMVRRNRGTLE